MNASKLGHRNDVPACGEIAPATIARTVRTVRRRCTSTASPTKTAMTITPFAAFVKNLIHTRKNMKYKHWEWIAWKLPKGLVYACYIRFMAHATTTDEGQKLTPNQMTFDKAIELWERTHGKLK